MRSGEVCFESNVKKKEAQLLPKQDHCELNFLSAVDTKKSEQVNSLLLLLSLQAFCVSRSLPCFFSPGDECAASLKCVACQASPGVLLQFTTKLERVIK